MLIIYIITYTYIINYYHDHDGRQLTSDSPDFWKISKKINK